MALTSHTGRRRRHCRRIGSEIRTDLDTLLSGREAANIRAILEQRGVVYFRGLEISDQEQVAIAKTLGNLVQSEGEEGIYKISLDDKVNERAKYLKGSLFWHFDGSLQPYPNLATLLRAIKLVRHRRRDRVLQHLRGLRRLAARRQGTRSPTFGSCTVPSGRSTT